MTDVSLDHNDLVAAARAGVRADAAHVRYSTDVKLAFGKHVESGRIKHISSVERGARCGCFCPACSEELVAKQGNVMAWHFAHASGGTCKEALSASFAAWLAQSLNDGKTLVVPPVNFEYGRQLQVVKGPSEPTGFVDAYAFQDDVTKPFEVRASLDTKIGRIGLRITLQVIRQSYLPNADMLRKSDEAGLVIDLREPLKGLLSQSGDVMLDEEWLEDTVLSSAPRRWIWSMKADRALERMRKNRLTGALNEIRRPYRGRPDIRVIQEELVASGLDRALLLDRSIVGEQALRHPPAVWRALFLHNRLLVPVRGKDNPLFLKHIGFSNKEIGGWLRANDIDPVPFRIARNLSKEDWVELGQLEGARPAFEIVSSYVRMLWEAGFLAAKPWRGTKSGTGPLDPHLAGRDMPFWRPSDTVIRSVRALD